MQQRAQSQRGRGALELFEQQQRVGPDVAFGMELGRLGDALHGGDFRQQIAQQARGVQHFEAAPRSAFGEDADQFVAHALGGNAQDGGMLAPERRERGRLDFEPQARGEANGAQQAQMVLAEARIGVANGADDAAVQILASADVIHHGAVQRVHQEAVDGEVAAQNVLAGIGFIIHAGGSAAIGIGVIAAEGGHFHGGRFAAYQHDAEMRADEIGIRKHRGDFLGPGAGGDVEILGGNSQQQVAHAAAHQKGLVARAAEGGYDDAGKLAGRGTLSHRLSVVSR